VEVLSAVGVMIGIYLWRKDQAAEHG